MQNILDIAVIGISTIDPVKVFQRLFNDADKIGNGVHDKGNKVIDYKEAKSIFYDEKYLDESSFRYFDYVYGKRLKLWFKKGDTILDYIEYEAFYGKEMTDLIIKDSFNE